MKIRIEFTVHVQVDEYSRRLFGSRPSQIREGVKFEAEDSLLAYLENNGVTVLVDGKVPA